MADFLEYLLKLLDLKLNFVTKLIEAADDGLLGPAFQIISSSSSPRTELAITVCTLLLHSRELLEQVFDFSLLAAKALLVPLEVFGHELLRGLQGCVHR